MNRNAARRIGKQLIPALAVVIILVPVFILKPRTMSYFGITLLLNLAIPLMFATLAQMFIMMVNDIDLSMGSFVGLVAVLCVKVLPGSIILGIGALLICLLVYVLVGALVQLRNVPAIVVTLGMSYVWLGISVMILPNPGGASPQWLQAAVGWRPPIVPLPIIAAVVVAFVTHFSLMGSGYGVVLRGIGGNANSVARAGWSVLWARVVSYFLAGLLAIFSGMTLAGTTTSADARIASQYTLLTVAGVILGGGDFVGGRVSPTGAVLGAITMMLAGSLLSFIHISPDWQIGAQGIILIIVLAARLATTREAR
jgi:ribose transport system permease protein